MELCCGALLGMGYPHEFDRLTADGGVSKNLNEAGSIRGKAGVELGTFGGKRLLVIPPGVWHSLRNVGPDEGSYIVLNDTLFDYANPDDWVLPPGSDLIPVRMDG